MISLLLFAGGLRRGWSWWRLFTSRCQQWWSDSAHCRRLVHVHV